MVPFKHFQVAKQYIEDSKPMFAAIEHSIKSLSPYSKYKPVFNMIRELQNNKSILEAHLQVATKIVKSVVIEGGKDGEK